MEQALMIVLTSLVGTLATCVAGQVIALLAHKIPAAKLAKLKAELELLEQQISTKQGIAYDAFVVVEDVYKEMAAPAKLAMVEQLLSAELTSHGLPVTASDIQTLISTAYADFRKAFGVDWGVTTTAVRVVAPKEATVSVANGVAKLDQ